MYLQEILEVGIGLVLVWLIISVAAMSVQEWIANLLKWRSTDLEGEIRKLLSDPALVEDFYKHQMIRSLSKTEDTRARLVVFWNRIRKIFKRPPIVPGEPKPDYIPSGDFALTLFDLVMQAGTDASPIKNAFAETRTEIEKLSLDRINYENKQEVQRFLDDMMEEARRIATVEIGYDSIDIFKSKILEFAKDHPEIKDAVNNILFSQLDGYYKKLLAEQSLYPPGEFNKDLNLKRLRVGLLEIEQTSPKLSQVLRSLFAGVEEYVNDKEKALAVARKNVETWFNDSMTLLSGWYKRKAQLVAFIIGILLAVLLNIDSINLATMLWREPTLRLAIVAEAQSYVAQNIPTPAPGSSEVTIPSPSDTFANVQKQIQALNIPVGWTSNPVPYDSQVPCGLSTATSYDAATGKALSLMGIANKEFCYPIVNALPLTWNNTLGWLSKLLGLFITGLAAAQGAPFWFDILKKMVNVRSSGSNPAEVKPKG